MGGDFGLHVSLPAVIHARNQFPDIDFVLVGDQPSIESYLDQHQRQHFNIQHASEIVLMSDKPTFALRNKKQSSMRIAIDLLQQQQVDAVVSAGNTGALMAIGCYVLKTLAGIDRPAICSAMPTADGHCYLLDLGANVDSSAKHLHQFAIMGAALAGAVDGLERPRIALLNIGEEEIKGNEQVKLAGKMLATDRQLNYVGSIEGHEIFKGKADVVVCDGFVGNVALKVCEGTATHIASIVKKQFEENLFSRCAAIVAMPVLKKIYQQLDPQHYNGASFLGLQGIVVKSHGNNTTASFIRAIAQARLEVANNILSLIDQRLAHLAD
jgi:glycerol-3-phosphate acyltransferase PlsX